MPCLVGIAGVGVSVCLDVGAKSKLTVVTIGNPLMLDARFLHRMVGYADNEHDPHIVGMNPDHGISLARPDVTWPIGRHWEVLTSFRVDDV